MDSISQASDWTSHIQVEDSAAVTDGDRSLRQPRRLSVEQLAYGLIFLAAMLTRFWDLGSRALHHDEAQHAYFSWIYAIGGGYVHDPLLHGPFLFHANALISLLFGATDATSRFMPAATGVAIVMLPWFLRGSRVLGRWGALAASVLMLLSPSILYYSRFIRHDVYTLFGTLLLFVAIARYVEAPQARWALIGAASVGFLLTTKEVCFIVFFIFGVFLIVAAIWRIAPILLAVGAAAGAGFLVIAKALAALGAPPLPSIPWSNPTGAQIRTFTFQLLVHPLVISAIGVGLLTLVVSIWLLNRRREIGAGWIDGLMGEAPAGSTSAALRELLSDRHLLFASIGAAVAIYTVLYTSLFTNPIGLATGSVGALGYWLGQQNVQRGQEPWFYYLLMLPQYEFVGVVLFPIGLMVLCKDTLIGWRRRIPFDHRWWMRAFIAFWAVMMFAVLSWAGEKMPWLTVHIALPLILLSAMLVGDAIGWLEQRCQKWRPALRHDLLLFGGLLIAIGAVGFSLFSWMSDGAITGTGNAMARQIRPEAAAHWWILLGLPVVVFVVVITLGTIRFGGRGAMTGTLVASVVVLILFQIHAEWRMTYRQGDVPKDMLIYVQTSPYVPQLTQDLTQFSLQQTGDMSLNVWFDAVTSWPFNWYLRNFPQRHYFGSDLPATVDAPIVLIGSDSVNAGITAKLKDNYTMQEYPMRWWFPEEQTYRRFAYAPDIISEARQNYQDNRKPPFSIGDVALSVVHTLESLRSPREQAKLFRLVAFRELPSPVQSTNFRVYIRNDLVPQFDAVRYRGGG